MNKAKHFFGTYFSENEYIGAHEDGISAVIDSLISIYLPVFKLVENALLYYYLKREDEIF